MEVGMALRVLVASCVLIAGMAFGEATTDVVASSEEMKAIYEADQAIRQNWFELSQPELHAAVRADAKRRRQTRELLEAGKLRTGEDFRRAAFVFQHGGEPEHYLLAHTLAMVAVARGDESALWIGAATLDRYLQSIEQPQIFGTQFKSARKEGATQKPYDRDLVPDSLRGLLAVPPLAEQAEQLERYKGQFTSGGKGAK